MHIKNCLTVVAATLVAATSIMAQPKAKGYYKDVFMDSGIKLTSRQDLPSMRYLDLSMEKFVSSTNWEINGNYTDTILQQSLINGNPMDENGCLLYPDGQPRFRAIYMNGGRANSHGKTLGEKGRANIRQFIQNGGSYVGTCAGMFIASKGTHPFSKPDTLTNYDAYMGIWPSYTVSTGLGATTTGHFVEPDSPLLKYYDFGGDMYIDSVYHNGGGYTMQCDLDRTPGAEVLLRYDKEYSKQGNKMNCHKQASAWAWKENATTGRLVLCGSHPEGETRGERLQLYCAFIKYALDGCGEPAIKGELTMGEPRKMNKCTHDDDPAYTRIGDKQYHHFTVEIPEGRDTVLVKLQSVKGLTNYDMYLFANYDGLAYKDHDKYEDVTLGFDKTLVIPAPKAGKLYISVFCDTTVEARETSYGVQYAGRTDVLNGVPYIITVE